LETRVAAHSIEDRIDAKKNQTVAVLRVRALQPENRLESICAAGVCNRDRRNHAADVQKRSQSFGKTTSIDE